MIYFIFLLHIIAFLYISSQVINYIDVTISTNSILTKTDDIWPCVNFDHWPEDKCDQGQCQWLNNSLEHIDLSNKLLQNAINAFNGDIRIRLGGTLGDCILYDIGPQASECVEFSSYNISYRWGYQSFTGCLRMKRWEALNNFCLNHNCTILFGVNALWGREYIGKCPNGTNCAQITPHPACCSEWTGAWDPSMADAFFSYTSNIKHQVYAFEFGNEVAGSTGIEAQISAQQYIVDFTLFTSLVRKYFGNSIKTVTTDSSFDQAFLSEFLQGLSNEYKPDILTNHLYSLGAGTSASCGPNALNPTKLNNVKNHANEMDLVIQQYAPNTIAWVGEAGGAYGSGRDRVTNAYNSPFWYLDQMALFANGGFGSYCRQALAGGFYSLLNVTGFEPTPDYYSLLTWSKTMGPSILSTNVNDKIPISDLRVYTHCAKYPTYPAGAITLLILNYNDTLTIEPTINLPDMNINNQDIQNMERYEFLFTSQNEGLSSIEIMEAKYMKLNGVLLQSINNTIPNIIPKVMPNNSQSAISLPPYSFAFIVLPNAKVQVCKNSYLPTNDNNNNTSKKKELSSGIKALISILVIILFAIVCYIVYRYYISKKDKPKTDVGESLLSPIPAVQTI